MKEQEKQVDPVEATGTTPETQEGSPSSVEIKRNPPIFEGDVFTDSKDALLRVVEVTGNGEVVYSVGESEQALRVSYSEFADRITGGDFSIKEPMPDDRAASSAESVGDVQAQEDAHQVDSAEDASEKSGEVEDSTEKPEGGAHEVVSGTSSLDDVFTTAEAAVAQHA